MIIDFWAYERAEKYRISSLRGSSHPSAREMDKDPFDPIGEFNFSLVALQRNGLSKKISAELESAIVTLSDDYQ
ncbi:hypothetical protein KIN20_030002 [Parelaphostrongylus tenuis]|uniref:Uncharacterized protein n=1 Tax=Parelaphostrongylus tenuis TaxID=148309 RepID=A0AAD5WG05_PARTN|nr:hypothetical protein KIN20_030002 [Parelaphostrongylus tenuis]